jgi:hypothetical protein
MEHYAVPVYFTSHVRWLLVYEGKLICYPSGTFKGLPIFFLTEEEAYEYTDRIGADNIEDPR